MATGHGPGRKARQVPDNRLHELRTARGLKMYELASRVKIDGSTLYRYERRETAIPDEVKIQLAKFYKVSVDHLMADWGAVPSIAPRTKPKVPKPAAEAEANHKAETAAFAIAHETSHQAVEAIEDADKALAS